MATNNRIALVTGGSRGLGKNMALSLAGKGIGVVLTYLSKKDEAQAVVQTIEQGGGKAYALQLDTGDIRRFDVFFREFTAVLKDHFNADRFDFLINNAGIGHYALFENNTEEAFDRVMNINFKAVFFLTQQALPLMNDGGRIINLSSGLARFTIPGNSLYAALKGAIETLTRYLAVELGPRRITVNTLAPGAIETDFNGGAVRDNPQYNKMVADSTALGRVGLPDDIGGVAAFLCSDEARWINAQRLEVSGGQKI
jgi:NAD(P)-dependent dehydrogenase (short-subunit alcohol dehydrogenase family)